jgi:hypothetical protein
VRALQLCALVVVLLECGLVSSAAANAAMSTPIAPDQRAPAAALELGDALLPVPDDDAGVDGVPTAPTQAAIAFAQSLGYVCS